MGYGNPIIMREIRLRWFVMWIALVGFFHCTSFDNENALVKNVSEDHYKIKISEYKPQNIRTYRWE